MDARLAVPNDDHCHQCEEGSDLLQPWCPDCGGVELHYINLTAECGFPVEWYFCPKCGLDYHVSRETHEEWESELRQP